MTRFDSVYTMQMIFDGWDMPFKSTNLVNFTIRFVTRFNFVYNADDFDRSINEAIKITKYGNRFFLMSYLEGIYVIV